MSVFSAAAVANDFLKLQERDSASFPRIDNLKIQKLIFYAHAWHLAIKNAPLIEESIEAWPWGPVVRPIYFEFRQFEDRPIIGKLATQPRVENDANGRVSLCWYTPCIPEDAADTKDFIRMTWGVHKEYTGIQLSNATHAPGEPWRIIKDQHGDLQQKPQIPDSLISAVFKAKLQ